MLAMQALGLVWGNLDPVSANLEEIRTELKRVLESEGRCKRQNDDAEGIAEVCDATVHECCIICSEISFRFQNQFRDTGVPPVPVS